MKQHLFISLFLLIALGLLAACSAQIADTGAPAAEATAAPANVAPTTDSGTEPEIGATEPAGPTAEATEAPMATATSEAVAADGLCLDVPRPALALFIPGEAYLITNPLSGESCTTTLDGDNLYALRLNTDADPVLIFDCADDHVVLCIGDFY